ncbi:MAG: response regulator, partial [Saprospiraceae bacterium]|nr:response regulator [Saprospiraceae bacterium]
MKAIIVEDSRLARVELLTLLQAHPEVEVIGEAANAEEAKTLLGKTEVDLLFLDIQLPGANGFELLESLDEVPVVIFTTAYDAYALKSFEYNA